VVSEVLQLREDRFDRRVASLVMGAGTVEHFRKHFEINDLGNIEEGLGLLTAFQLMGAQEFRSLFADPIALGLHKSRLSVVQKAQSSLLPNRLHQEFVHVRRVANRPACSSIRRACSKSHAHQSVIRLSAPRSYGVSRLRPNLVRADARKREWFAYDGVGLQAVSRARSRWLCQRPNNSLEPTPVSNAPSLRVSSGAAQLNRYVARNGY
jgi:hypothetical protein